MTAWILLAVSLVLIVACGVFVAAEFAFVTVDRSRVEQLAAEGDSGAIGVLAALRTLSTQLSGAQVGITVTNLAIGFLAEPAIAELISPPLEAIGIPEDVIRPLAIGLGLAIGATLTMIFGELVPEEPRHRQADGDRPGDAGLHAALHDREHLAHQAAERLGQRHRPRPRDGAAGGAALGALARPSSRP